MAYFQNWRRFYFLSKCWNFGQVEGRNKVPGNRGKIWNLGRLMYDKEKGSSSLMVCFRYWRNYEPLLFCFFVKKLKYRQVEEEHKKFRKIEEKFDICVDLGVIKKKVPLHRRFIFRTDGAMSFCSFVFCQKVEIVTSWRGELKYWKIMRKMRYLGKFICDKEKSSSS